MLNLYNANNHDKNVVPLVVDPAKAKQAKSKAPSFEKYVDPTGELPTSNFKWAIWYVTHKILLYKILVGFLIGFSVLTILFGLWKWGDYFIFGIAEDQLLERSISTAINYSGINQSFSAQPLQIAGTQILVSGVNRYDIISEVANPNPRFVASFDYAYQLGGDATTAAQHAMLLPGETRPLVFLGYADGTPGASTGLVLSNVTWDRIDAHQAPDIENWQKDRLNFVVTDFSFVASRSAEDANAHIIRFKLTDDSLYGYNAPSFQVGLFDNGSLVGILPWSLDRIKSGETVSVDLRSFAPDLNVSEIKVFPLINIYDKEVYLPIE